MKKIAIFLFVAAFLPAHQPKPKLMSKSSLYMIYSVRLYPRKISESMPSMASRLT